MEDRVKVRCPACRQVFREKVGKVREGSQINCQHCNKLLTFSRESEDPFMRRALKAAKEIRTAIQEGVVQKAYGRSEGAAEPQVKVVDRW
ncbi:transposase-like protein [Bradyrhizobium sp. USDA 4474]